MPESAWRGKGDTMGQFGPGTAPILPRLPRLHGLAGCRREYSGHLVYSEFFFYFPYNTLIPCRNPGGGGWRGNRGTNGASSGALPGQQPASRPGLPYPPPAPVEAWRAIPAPPRAIPAPAAPPRANPMLAPTNGPFNPFE